MHRYTLFPLLLLLLGALAFASPATYAGGDEDSDAPPTAAPNDEEEESDEDILPGMVIPKDLVDLAQDMASFEEDVDDLQEPVDEFAQFDQCMFLIGVTSFGGPKADTGFPFMFRAGRTQRAALSMDVRGLAASQFDFLAFPGEEPPQIECNEDAGGENTDE